GGGGSSGTFPLTIAEVTSKWLDSYSAITGIFHASQPTFADIAAGTSLAGLLIGTGGSLGVSGTGTIAATSVPWSGVSSPPQLAQTIAVGSHEWLASYSATTGLFTQSQPSTADLSDWSDTGVSLSPPTGNGLVPIWNSSTGKWTPGQTGLLYIYYPETYGTL